MASVKLVRDSAAEFSRVFEEELSTDSYYRPRRCAAVYPRGPTVSRLSLVGVGWPSTNVALDL
jgi:hypothetical protein